MADWVMLILSPATRFLVSPPGSSPIYCSPNKPAVYSSYSFHQLVGYAQEAFEKIKDEYTGFVAKLGIPDVQFILFFVYHGGIIAAVIYLTLGARMRPWLASIPRVAAWTILYGAVAGAADWALGTNGSGEPPDSGGRIGLAASQA